MFKRAQKRRRRQQKEEELGLDAETKEVLGLHDSDSDELSSDSDSDDDSENENFDEGAAVDQESAVEGNDVPSDEDVSDADLDDEPPLSVADALENPVYTIEPELYACVVCTRKRFKNPIMCDVHTESPAHLRRYKRFIAMARDADPDQNVRELVHALTTALPKKEVKEGALSNRAIKNEEKIAKNTKKRERQKAAKAKALAKKHAKLAVADNADSVAEQTKATSGDEGKQAAKSEATSHTPAPVAQKEVKRPRTSDDTLPVVKPKETKPVAEGKSSTRSKKGAHKTGAQAGAKRKRKAKDV
ncbi:uncharacterized protein LAESUDRAFT_815222 [Laetiporus sulphureus 93-53]|uniref:Uncharacterized protein n=1 Tax=Laetiporus sulphureus 93-53 TaxID=1314785 RepID=A0A165CCY7_9APHY|nr:uncharacterized protein LAESUDRAFT_815222 [Laetiporus sulphureus 93-53]KZT02586.1 hypothetical protein LAESUDRAFT_815222 [Laetiporus sulphureus 93-53]